MIIMASEANVPLSADFLAALEAAAARKSFPGHRGRPGQVGGSLPRDGGAMAEPAASRGPTLPPPPKPIEVAREIARVLRLHPELQRLVNVYDSNGDELGSVEDYLYAGDATAEPDEVNAYQNLNTLMWPYDKQQRVIDTLALLPKPLRDYMAETGWRVQLRGDPAPRSPTGPPLAGQTQYIEKQLVLWEMSPRSIPYVVSHEAGHVLYDMLQWWQGSGGSGVDRPDLEIAVRNFVDAYRSEGGYTNYAHAVGSMEGDRAGVHEHFAEMFAQRQVGDWQKEMEVRSPRGGFVQSKAAFDKLMEFALDPKTYPHLARSRSRRKADGERASFQHGGMGHEIVVDAGGALVSTSWWYVAAAKSFPGHRGRPGEVGGSLPRDAAGGESPPSSNLARGEKVTPPVNEPLIVEANGAAYESYRQQVHREATPAMDYDTFKDAAIAKEKELLRDAKPFIRIDPETMGKVLDDGEFKSQHESGDSNGLYDPSYRYEMENRLFGPKWNAAGYPVYGYLTSNADGDGHGIGHYGTVRVRLKDDVLDRTTFTLCDSLDTLSDGDSVAPSPVRDPAPGSADSADIFATSVIERPAGHSYTEAQFHGHVRLGDIQYVVMEAGLSGKHEADERALNRRLTEMGIPVRWRRSTFSSSTKRDGVVIARRGQQQLLVAQRGDTHGWVVNEVGEVGPVQSILAITARGYWRAVPPDAHPVLDALDATLAQKYPRDTPTEPPPADQSVGEARYGWLTAGDEKVCPVCFYMEAVGSFRVADALAQLDGYEEAARDGTEPFRRMVEGFPFLGDVIDSGDVPPTESHRPGAGYNVSELTAMGALLPPAHIGCRCGIVLV